MSYPSNVLSLFIFVIICGLFECMLTCSCLLCVYTCITVHQIIKNGSGIPLTGSDQPPLQVFPSQNFDFNRYMSFCLFVCFLLLFFGVQCERLLFALLILVELLSILFTLFVIAIHSGIIRQVVSVSALKWFIRYIY